MKKAMWDLKEERLEQQLQELAQQGDWNGVVEALDDYDRNNDRRQGDHRDDFDFSCLNGGASADGHYQIPNKLKLAGHHFFTDCVGSAQSGNGVPRQHSYTGADAPAAGDFKAEYRLWHPDQGHRKTDGVYHPKHYQAAAESAGEDPPLGYRPAETRGPLIVHMP